MKNEPIPLSTNTFPNLILIHKHLINNNLHMNVDFPHLKLS
ncbi:hypothetical protein OKW21_005137 [Catalinimonas alkaloidigena]|nr:hypothetical protein [Catalinimonas alkaloidigena]